jgi:hypothetical protein
MALEFTGWAHGEAESMTLFTHQAGDLLLMFAYRESNSAPSAAAGWTLITSGDSANTSSALLYYKIAASSSETSGTWSSADALVCLGYRGVSSVGAFGGTTGNSATMNYPALTLNNTSGSSWVVGMGGHRSILGDLSTPPTGMVNRAVRAGSGCDVAGHDTNGGVASWSSQNVSTGSSSGWRTFVVELIPSATPATGNFFPLITA